MMRVRLLTILLIGLNQISTGQELEDFDYYSTKYKGNTVVNSLEKSVLDIRINRDGELVILVENERRRIYLKDNAAQFSKGSVNYSEHFKLKEIEAYSLLPNGGKYKKEKVADFSTKTEFSSGIFHNGQESVNFFYPSLSKGAVSVVKHSEELSIAQLLSSFYVGSYYPTEVREIEIRIQKGVNLEFSYVNASDPKYQPTIEEGRKGKVYRWKLKDIPAVEFDDQSPDLSFYTPHIVPRISSYEHKGETTNVLRDVGDLYNWYYSLVEKTDKEPNAALKAVVDSLINDGDEELDKIKKIYYWVQDNIRYVAFEEGMQGFIPDDAGKVCDKKYGDCKGLTSILYSMFDYAGIEAYFTWVGTRDRPYKYEEVPTPIVDNHMILSYKYKGEFYFLDGTSNTSPVTEPTSFIQGKEVMVGIGKDEYKIIEVPVKPYSYTAHNDTIYLSINKDGVLKGKGKATQSGFYNSSTKSFLKLTETDDLEDFMKSYLERGSNKCELDTFWISDVSDREGSLVMNYEFTLEDYANINEDEIYLNLSLNQIYTNENFKKDRKVPYELRFKSSNETVVSLSVPEGYEVSYVPKNVEYNKDLFGCSVEIKNNGKEIVQTFKQYEDFLILQPESFNDWNQMIRNLKRIYRESVILKKV